MCLFGYTYDIYIYIHIWNAACLKCYLSGEWKTAASSIHIITMAHCIYINININMYIAIRGPHISAGDVASRPAPEISDNPSEFSEKPSDGTERMDGGWREVFMEALWRARWKDWAGGKYSRGCLCLKGDRYNRMNNSVDKADERRVTWASAEIKGTGVVRAGDGAGP